MKLTSIIVLFLFKYAASGSLEKRLVGGGFAVAGQFPYQVSLRNGVFVHFCGGSIIKDYWVLTSAHCIFNTNPQYTNVVVGTILLTSGGTTLQIKKYIFNQGYNPTTLKSNIALIQTFDRILNTWGTAVVPINLASVLLGQVGYISGWGQVNLSSSVYSTKLKYIRATVIAINYCKQLLPQYIIDDTMLCTLDIGQGNCHGDNGNPLVSNNVLIGLVSWGIPCAVGKPDVLTNIVSFSSWIILNSQN
ncbi:hypothetical protein FQA39_LY18685 [Lamprigera yunnana]|nr:hypothetical protein FQA39_LY18685 [Lamprigera yunnana]